MFCKNCGRRLDEDEKFCKNCGLAQSIEADRPMTSTVAPQVTQQAPQRTPVVTVPTMSTENVVVIGSLAASVLTIILLLVNWVDITYLTWYGEKSKFSALSLYFGIKSLGENTIIDYESGEFILLKYLSAAISMTAVVTVIILVVVATELIIRLRKVSVQREKQFELFAESKVKKRFVASMVMTALTAGVFLIMISALNEKILGKTLFEIEWTSIATLILSLVFAVGASSSMRAESEESRKEVQFVIALGSVFILALILVTIL